MAIQLKRKHGGFEQSDIDQLLEGQPAIDLDSGTMVVGDGKGDVVIVGSPQVAAEASLREDADNALQAAIEDEVSARLELQEHTYSKIVDESTSEELVTIARSTASENFSQGTKAKTRIDNQLVRVDYEAAKGWSTSNRKFANYDYQKVDTGTAHTTANGKNFEVKHLLWSPIAKEISEDDVPKFTALDNDYSKNPSDYVSDNNGATLTKTINLLYPMKSGTLALQSEIPVKRVGDVSRGNIQTDLATISITSNVANQQPYASAALGYCTITKGNYQFAAGKATINGGQFNTALNRGTVIDGVERATALGTATACANDQLAIGCHNNLNANALFIVGKGSDKNNLSNAFEVLADGRATVQTAPVNNNDVVRKLELDKKLDKVTSGNGVIYATDASNQFEAIPWYVSNPKANSIPRRDANGRLMAADAGSGGYDVVNNNTILRGKGVDYTYRDSAQTSTISNGRIKATDNKSDQIVNVTKWGQIEPMGFTARYNTGKGDASYQQTTVCINPNDITSIPEGGNEITVTNLPLNSSIIYSDVADNQTFINLGLMGYSDIVPGTVTIKSANGTSVDNINKVNDGSCVLSGDAFLAEGQSSSAIVYKNAQIILNGVSTNQLTMDTTISFKYKQLENYIYLPNKTGTIALKSELPTFTLSGDTLYIDLPE